MLIRNLQRQINQLNLPIPQKHLPNIPTLHTLPSPPHKKHPTIPKKPYTTTRALILIHSFKQFYNFLILFTYIYTGWFRLEEFYFGGVWGCLEGECVGVG